MKDLSFRQIHLDFHTSGLIPNIGGEFNREQFGAALKAGHVNSITLFSKCHHGYAYHPSTANEMHPNLNFDLLGEQLAVCRELGVRAPVYISAGLDEKEAMRHSDWLSCGSPNAGHDFVNQAGYHLFCYNTPYLDKLVAQVEEVMERYNPCEIFLDISNVRICYCPYCVKSMLEKGLDPRNIEDVTKHGEEVYANYCKRIEEAVRKYNPDTAIFHNAGNITRGRRDLAGYDTHLELESLPTGGWGYDHFPMSASYARTLGKEYLGMTGKFHTSWGEFGGFKHPNALRYETALSIALGAKCSIGDQLHPNGKMNTATYELIGKAYAEVEQKEAWCSSVEAVSDIAVLSSEACNSNIRAGRNNTADIGACRMLLEGKYLFDLIDLETPFDSYKLLILPDHIRINDALKCRIDKFIADGGKVLLSGQSGLKADSDEFAFEVGAEYKGLNAYKPSYMSPSCGCGFANGITEYVMYESGYDIDAAGDSTVTAYIHEPYFNRDAFHFSSHRHTPDKPGKHEAAVLTKNTAYIGWNIFDDYAVKGTLHLKELVIKMIEALIGDSKTLETNLPDRAVATLMKQPEENRLVNHLLFAHTTLRGDRIEVIQDTVPLYDIDIKIKLANAPKRVYKAPQNEDMEYSYNDGVLSYNVDKFDIHQMVVIDL